MAFNLKRHSPRWSVVISNLPQHGVPPIRLPHATVPRWLCRKPQQAGAGWVGRCRRRLWFHAEFRSEDGEFSIVDTASFNGTYVNRQPVDSAILTHGDEIQIGNFRLVFMNEPARSNT